MNVLDHGYVTLIESWGSDRRIIESARMSTAKGFQGWGPITKCMVCTHESMQLLCENPDHKHLTLPGDEKLLRYLRENHHDTPFEFAGMTLEVQAPIFVFREWHRHRTQSYNEMSARYAPLPDVNYIPTLERCMLGGGHLTKQAGTASGAEALTDDAAHEWLNALSRFYDAAEVAYQEGLRIGLPKELARVVLPVGRYSKMRASANLRNWLAFLTLRQAANAQFEIRQYANAVGTLIAEAFPRTWALFTESL